MKITLNSNFRVLLCRVSVVSSADTCLELYVEVNMDNMEAKAAVQPKNIECLESELQGIPVSYYIDRAEGSVTGVMHISGTEVIKLVQRHLMSETLSNEEINILMLYLPDKVEAVVHCHPDDTFVAEEGIRRVNAKLNCRFSRIREDALLKYYNFLTKRILTVEKCLKKYPVERLASSAGRGRNTVDRAVAAMNEFRYVLQYGHSSKWK